MKMYGEFKEEHVPGAQRGNMDDPVPAVANFVQYFAYEYMYLFLTLVCEYSHFFNPKPLRWCEEVKYIQFQSAVCRPTGNLADNS